ncbi:MAG: Dam family site-specific DNA-(adenine-N6)-methyltransferase [Aquiluna sp.]|nr:Dam family site-specific DNA-(adenine-N6)-methyltransferase [Aquiluna sp.]
MEPVLKWVGGKRAILSELDAHFPSRLDGTYFEPFLGGGAVAFSREYSKISVSDANQELIRFYEVVRDHPTELFEVVSGFPVDEKFFYEIRGWDRASIFDSKSKVQLAARTLYLNRCGFNGLFRVNSRGQFNVPFGKKTSLDVRMEKLLALSRKLSGELGNQIEIMHSDFDSVLGKARPGDLVYFDPPYLPLSSTSNFVSYSITGFSNFDHLRLANSIEQLTKMGVRVLMSNSDTPRTREIFGGLGALISLNVQRNLSADGSKRGKVAEVIFDNAGRL